MPQNSKPRRQRPADHVPQGIMKDAATPGDNSQVVCEGEALNEYLDELQRDKRLDFEF